MDTVNHLVKYVPPRAVTKAQSVMRGFRSVREGSDAERRAVVVLSGGQDSTTCLFFAKYLGYDINTVTFDYGQRHRVETLAAMAVASMADVGPDRFEIVALGEKVLKGTSPLVSGEPLEQYADHHSLPGGLEKTFVPMRNQLFLTVAANRAYNLGAKILFTGVCEEDSGGYPDCRSKFIRLLEQASTAGTFTGEDGAPGGLGIYTPLMQLTKAESVVLALLLPDCYIALAFTVTGYDGAYPPTGKDHATLLRAKGFEESGLPDPLVVRAWMEDLMKLPLTPNYEFTRVAPVLRAIKQQQGIK